MNYEELLNLKEQYPYGALDAIWNMDICSSKVDVEASTEKFDQLSESSKANLLNELCTEILEQDLCQVIEQDENNIPKIKDLLHRLTTSSLDRKFIKFATELEPLFDQIIVDLQRYRDGRNNIADHIREKDDFLTEITTIKKKVDNFKRKPPNVQDRVEKYDEAIANHQRSIHDLEVKRQMLLDYDDELGKEAKLSIEKASELKVKNDEIARLTIESECFGGKLACSKAYLKIIKD